MTDFETHPVGTAARIDELQAVNGVHLPRVPSAEETLEIEKMVVEGRYDEAAEKFGGRVARAQEPRDLPTMTDAELVTHLRGGLVMVSVARRAAARIDQLEDELTRANAATAAAYEVAARECDYYAKSWDDLNINGSSISVIAYAIRALATADHTAALDRLIAEAEARVLERAAIIANKLLVRTKFGNDTLTEVVYSDFVGAAILAASKKGGA